MISIQSEFYQFNRSLAEISIIGIPQIRYNDLIFVSYIEKVSYCQAYAYAVDVPNVNGNSL
jgi:hypothetical protein